jgi:5-methylcytosine-specific restriction protein A
MENIRPTWLGNNKNNTRKSTADPRYKTNRWKVYSYQYRQKNPLCAICDKENKVSASELVDHIIRVNFGGSFYDKRNHQALCRTCHDLKSFKERNGLTYPYSLNESGEKIPYQGGGILTQRVCLPTPQASCLSSDGKNHPFFYHGGNIPQLRQLYRYDFPYFFGAASKMCALKYAELNKGKIYQFQCHPEITIDFDGITNSAEYIKLIYEIYEHGYKSALIKNCIDHSIKTDIILITDFDLVINLSKI